MHYNIWQEKIGANVKKRSKTICFTGGKNKIKNIQFLQAYRFSCMHPPFDLLFLFFFFLFFSFFITIYWFLINKYIITYQKIAYGENRFTIYISVFYKLKMYTVYVYELIRKKEKKSTYVEKTYTIYIKFLWNKDATCTPYVHLYMYVLIRKKWKKSLHWQFTCDFFGPRITKGFTTISQSLCPC